MNLGQHRLLGRRRALALAAVFMVAWAGCVSLQPSAPMPVPVARVAVANLTDYTWDIAMRPSAGESTKAERVAPRSIAQWQLAEGEYVIEQRLVGAPTGGQRVRTFPARFVAGVDYKWSLATLQSTETSELAAAPR